MSSVTVHHAELDQAISEATSLGTRIDRQASIARTNAPVELPSLSSHAITRVGTWLEAEIPMLEGLSTIARLLDTDGNGQATFEVTVTPYSVREMVGETLAEQGHLANPNFKEEFRTWADEYSQWVNDPQVMASFYENITAEGALRLMSNIAGPDGVGPDDFVPFEERQALLNQLRTGLEQATTHSGFPDEQYARDLVEQATTDPEDLFGRGVYNPSGALAFLLRDGDFDRPFLETMATELDHYERVENNGASGLWGDRPMQDADFGQFMPHGTAMTYDNLDPMAGLMSAMENDPEYALEFFSDDSHEEGQPHRSYYYIHDRNWDQDGYQGITGALDAATTDPSVIGDPDSPEARDAAMLASRTVEYFSERDNIDELPERMAQWGSFGDNDSSQNLAHIMTTYMPSVDAALDPTKTGTDYDPGVFTLTDDARGGLQLVNSPLFDREALDKFGLLAMASDEGFAEVRAGVTDYRQETLGNAVNRYADDPAGNEEMLQNALNDDARREGYFVRLIGEQDISEGAAEDARTQAWIDFGSEVVDLVPIPGVDQVTGVGGDIINAAIDRGKGAGTDAITSALVNAEEGARADAQEAAGSTLDQQSYAVASLLAERGLLADQSIEIPTWDEYQDMNDGERATLWESLNSTERGVGRHFSSTDYADVYNSEHTQYFYDK
jgi:hypothetical protein